MTKKIKIAAVSYLNTKPLLYGLLHHPIRERIDLQLAIPSVCAAKLKQGEVDLALAPVAIIPELARSQVVSDYCIGTDGAVRTVAVFGEVPIEKMTKIYLDFHSRTSVELLKILLKKHWRINPQLVPANEGFEQNIKGTTGALIIGDRTVDAETRFPFRHDLGAAWKTLTGLPFVFAAWISRDPLPSDFLSAFNEALASGIRHIPELVYLIPPPAPDFSLETYFTRHIDYHLDAKKRAALQRFLNEMGAAPVADRVMHDR